MKLLMINSVCGTGSTGRFCTDLATELESRGHEVRIAYGRGSVPERYSRFAVRIGSDTDVKLHGLKARFFDASGFGSKRATERFIEWVKEYDPDVIHLHNIHGYYLNVRILFDYLKTCGKRILWTQHDCWAFTGHSAYCDSVSCEKWRTGCENCPLKNGYPKSLTDFSARNYKAKKQLFRGAENLTLITPSEWLKGWTEESFLGDYPVEVIHNGIDTSVFRAVDSDFREKHGLTDKTVLLAVSFEWDSFKGYGDYLKLAGMLDDSFAIVMVGVTRAQLAELPERIIGIEKTADVNELAQLYTAADCLLNLTYTDNFPTVNMEAIACGTPVVTYDSGGSAESAFGNAVKVKKGDVTAALNAVKTELKGMKVSVDRDEIDKKTAVRRYLEAYTNT